jgi:hypothetical protein
MFLALLAALRLAINDGIIGWIIFELACFMGPTSCIRGEWWILAIPFILVYSYSLCGQIMIKYYDGWYSYDLSTI